ncbi:MAG TPA: NAD(P)H-hydrate dehydratase, partial [Acidimicrobiales bacterium]|nr:NAD(P)H-hydrate dehydratase [Acidimicrobiales bacterium]
RLATAGSGDVLAGIIATLIGHSPTALAVAAAAHWHGRAATFAEPGMVADDLPSLLQPARSAMLSP